MSAEKSPPPATTAKPTPKKERQLDPDVKRLREEHNAKVAALRADQRSESTLKRILIKDLPHLNAEHRAALRETLAQSQIIPAEKLAAPKVA